jgi:hypothetical protein
MIKFFSAVEALSYCLIFMASILLSEAVIDYQKTYRSPHQSKIKICVLLVTTRKSASCNVFISVLEIS